MTIRIYSIRVHGTKSELNRTGVRNITAEICYMSTGGLNPFPKIGMLPSDVNRVVDEEDQEFIGHMAPVCSVAFSSTGSELYSGDEAGHIVHWWWRADPHVDFSIAALSADNTTESVTKWMHTLLNAFNFPRIGFDIELDLCNTVDIDSGVQLLTMIMAKKCFGGGDRGELFEQLFFAAPSASGDHNSKKFLAGAIAGGTNTTETMTTRNGHESKRSPLEIIFGGMSELTDQADNVLYGATMLDYWLSMGRTAMYDPPERGKSELLANFLHISTAVAKILPTLAKFKIELAMDVLKRWAHEGLSLVQNPYAAYLASDSPHKFKQLFAHSGSSEGEILDILPDSSDTPYGESLLSVKAADFLTDRQYKHATDGATFRTEEFRFHVAPTVSAGFVPVVPCVFSLPHDHSRPISESLLHILVARPELFDVIFDEKAESELKSSPGIAVLVEFKWRQYARREYMAQFFTYLVHYLCFCVFCYGLVIERQYYSGPPCNVFSESSVNDDWNTTDEANGVCIHFSPSFAELFNITDDDGYTVGNVVFYSIMGGITLFFCLYHMVMVTVQNRTLAFWASINKNPLDMAVYLMMAATVIAFFCRTVQVGAVGSVTSVLAGWKFMLSWRGFSSMSHYIRTIIEITRFSYIFLFMMIFFSIGCGWAFMLLFGGWKEEHLNPLGIEFEGADGANQYELFGTFWRTIVTSWDFMVGNTDIEAWLDSYYELIAIPLFFFFSFMVVLVMLNLVIALMADGYTTVMETQSKAKIIERARIIVGIEKTLPTRLVKNDRSKFPTWVHALMAENKGGTPIGDMPAGFEDIVDGKLDQLVTSLAKITAERAADRAALDEALARITELQQQVNQQQRHPAAE